MKNFLIKNLEHKIVAAMFFTSEVIIYILIAPFIGKDSIPVILIWQMILLAILLTLLQYAIYWSKFLENVKTPMKIIMHYISILIFGGIFTVIFNWFDITNIKNLIIAVSVLTVTFVLFVTSVGLYYKFNGDEFNEKLNLYKSKKNKGE